MSRLSLGLAVLFILGAGAAGHSQDNLKSTANVQNSPSATSTGEADDESNVVRPTGAVRIDEKQSASLGSRDSAAIGQPPPQATENFLSRLSEAMFGIKRTHSPVKQNIAEHFDKLTPEEKRRALSRCDEIIQASLRVSPEVADICVVIAAEKQYSYTRD